MHFSKADRDPKKILFKFYSSLYFRATLKAAKKYIEIRKAHLHNLKHINVDIPREQLTVVTGVSGSGKSSLVFDTLYAEGQRRYVESLSSYARQFMGRMEKPKVESISGLTPSIAISQKVGGTNARSTVATKSEIYDYLKILFARAGKTISPISGQEVKKESAEDVLKFAQNVYHNFYIAFESKDVASSMAKGYTRCLYKGKFIRIEELEEEKQKDLESFQVIIDRFKVYDDSLDSRILQAAENSFWEGEGNCLLIYENQEKEILFKTFSNKYEADGIVFEEPNINLFNYNNPIGACKRCEGFGTVIGIDENLVIANHNLSLFEGCVVPWQTEKMKAWRNDFIQAIYRAKVKFDIHKPYFKLSQEEKGILWNGIPTKILGIYDFFQFLETNSYKIQYRVMLSRYRGKTNCPECLGTRIRKDASYVKLASEDGKDLIDIHQIMLSSIGEAYDFFLNFKFDKKQSKIIERPLLEITNRLGFLSKSGLSYLSLNRLANTLSGGEMQRISLGTSLGSSLTGSTYILDEPSIGLHSRDNLRLIEILKELRDGGNTVVVVEHDDAFIEHADHVIDIGPLAGTHGGEVVFQGNPKELLNKDTLTARFIKDNTYIPAKTPRKWNRKIELKGIKKHNLKNVSVSFPLNVLTVVCGVSGSGKTTLAKEILFGKVAQKLNSISSIKANEVTSIDGNFRDIDAVELIDQNPLGTSSRSNPVTYLKAYDAIRDLYAKQAMAKVNELKTGHFSFNVEGGRCEQCQGEGVEIIEMQFMADIKLPCESCKGKRFKDEVLQVEYKGKNIYNVLEMTVDVALNHFKNHINIVKKLEPLKKVGMGYVKLGQASDTLSGGEAQRIKLAYFLSKQRPNHHTLYIFDEPTTGLHLYDVKILLDAFNELIKEGNSVIVIEHHLDVIKTADWIIELGPDGGNNGGQIVFEGTPLELANNGNTATSIYIKNRLNR